MKGFHSFKMQFYYVPYPQYFFSPPQYITPPRQELPSLPLPSPKVPSIQPPALSVSLPKFKYEKQKITPIPFDPNLTDGKFFSLVEAMQFITKHARHFHKQINRNLVYIYIPFCRVYNAQVGDYISASLFPRKSIEAAYRSLTEKK